MKQTAVQWLVEKIQQANPTFKFDALIREAKAMEKEQIISAFLEGYLDDIPDPLPRHYYEHNAENYYNETFKSE